MLGYTLHGRITECLQEQYVQVEATLFTCLIHYLQKMVAFCLSHRYWGWNIPSHIITSFDVVGRGGSSSWMISVTRGLGLIA